MTITEKISSCGLNIQYNKKEKEKNKLSQVELTFISKICTKYYLPFLVNNDFNKTITKNKGGKR